jgi:Alr-MurF fusion protein
MKADDGYTADQVAAITAGSLVSHSHHTKTPISQLLTDSRKLVSPENSLFFALQSQNNDGHKYVKPLLEQGVRYFVVCNMQQIWLTEFPDAVFILVDNPLWALQQLAAHHRKQFHYPVVAITGSNGKTIVKEWLFQLLADELRIVRSPKSYNSQTGVPLSVWQMTVSDEMGIFEAGISMPGEMKRLQEVINPDSGIFTNIGPAHDAGFASAGEKIREKLLLFDKARVLIYCTDHEMIAKELRAWQKDHPATRLFGWGRGEGASVRLLDTKTEGKHTHLDVSYGKQEFRFSLPFTDEASVENAMHCVAYLLLNNYPVESVQRKMPLLQAVAMRLEMKEGINHCIIINDSYNSDLHSLSIALDFLNSQTRHLRSSLIISDIQQTGLPPAELYQRVADMVKSRKLHRLIGIGPDISAHAGLFSLPASFFPDTESFIDAWDLTVFQKEAILLKGARAFAFERLSELLQQKDHQTILEINLDALIHNLNVYRAKLSPGVRIMGMVKAFSYGSGSVEIAAALQYHKTDCLAVAYADEGKELRQGGIHIPIVVMNPEVRSFDTMFMYDLEPEVYSLSLYDRLLGAWSDYSIRHRNNSQEKALPIHLKIDTGMHRLGLTPGQLTEITDRLLTNPQLKVATVFSHLAASDETAHDAFSREQINCFEEACNRLQDALPYKFLRHICNSAAASRFPQAHFDMVRLGIGLYGVSHDARLQALLQHVSTFRSVISQIKEVKKGQSIGYGRSGQATADKKIAIIPVGYADGLNRRLGNGRGQLLIGGRPVPTIGHISMDMCAVDISGLEAKEGDEAIIFGPGWPITKMAEALETIPYEVLTSVSQRVKRVYFRE